MPTKSQGRIIGESFRECLGGYAAGGLLRENFHRLSGLSWFDTTTVASLSKCHWGRYPYNIKPFNAVSFKAEGYHPLSTRPVSICAAVGAR
jgi:hypothetical protein